MDGNNPADLTNKHLDVKRPTLLCGLLIVNHSSGRPSSAPKLTQDTEYISRALVVMILVRQTAATEVVGYSGVERDIEIQTTVRSLDTRL